MFIVSDIVHLISSQRSSPHEDFKHVIENLFYISSNESSQICQEKPMIIFSCYFSLPDSNASSFENIPSNVFLCPGPDIDLDYDISIKKVCIMCVVINLLLDYVCEIRIYIANMLIFCFNKTLKNDIVQLC